MSGRAVVTGYTGAGGLVTALALPDMTDFEFDLLANMVYITYGTPPQRFALSYNGVTTVTVVITAGVTVLTIS